MIEGRPEAVAWLVSAGFLGFFFLCFVAWLYEKSRPKLQHPKLGSLVFEWGSWVGLKENPDKESPAIRFELPGTKKSLEDDSAERFDQLWANLSRTILSIRPDAVGEFLSLVDEENTEQAEWDVYEELHQAVEKDDKRFDEAWSLVQITLEPLQAKPYSWVLEFEVEWDPEHTRSAYLDSDGQLLSYGLSCAESGLDDDS